MGRRPEAKTERRTAPAHAPHPTLQAYCPDLSEWPQRWHIEERDLASGQILLDLFTPFLEHLLHSGLARKTLRRHRDNLWLLGGEIIGRLHDEPALRKQSLRDLLLELLDDDAGGPLIHPMSEEDQRSVDATCRKLNAFLLSVSGTKP